MTPTQYVKGNAPPPPLVDERGFLEAHCRLPPRPEVVGKLLERIHSGTATAGEIAELLVSDAGLVAQILKIVNSAYYGLPRRITEARHAVAYLGLAEIERVALTASVMRDLAPEDKEQFERFWLHSFYAALISKRIRNKYAHDVNPEELHTAVLLHDIGKLVYMKFFPQHYRELMRYRDARKVLLTDAERALGYPSHQNLGAMLCQHWRLPETVERACRHHELERLKTLDASEPDAEEVRLICLANLLSNLATETLEPEVKESIRRSTMEALDCDERDFLLLMGEIYELKSDVESFLRQL